MHRAILRHVTFFAVVVNYHREIKYTDINLVSSKFNYWEMSVRATGYIF